MYPIKLLEAGFAFLLLSVLVLLFVACGEPEALAGFTAPLVSAMM